MENVAISTESKNITSNSIQKNKKSAKKGSSLKTIGVQSGNTLTKRSSYRTGRIQEETKNFLSIPDEDSRTILSSNPSSGLSHFSSSSRKAKSQKSSHNSSKIKSKTINSSISAKNNQNTNATNSIFEASKLLKQPTQSKKYNLDFDSRWEYFLELKTLDDATKRIYNSAFFQLWKTIYQKRYMKRAEEQASQIESTLDRFNSSHNYNNSLSNSYNPNYQSNYQVNNYDSESRMNRGRNFSNGYSFNSFYDSSESRVEKMQQKYRKRYDNYNNEYSFINRNNNFNFSNIENNITNDNNNNQKYRNNNYSNFINLRDESYNDNNVYSVNHTNNTKTSAILYSNNNSINLNYNNNPNVAHINYNNNSNIHNSNINSIHNNQVHNQEYNINSNHKKNIPHFQSDNSFNFDYLRPKNISMKTFASESIQETKSPKLSKDMISPSKSYDPSVSKELINEIEGKISGQNEKELAKDFATQLDAIAHFNSTLSEYNNRLIDKDLNKEEEENTEKRNIKLDSKDLVIMNNVNNSLNNSIPENDYEEEEEEININNLNNSNNFINNTERFPHETINSSNQFGDNQLQPSVEQIFTNESLKQKLGDNKNLNKYSTTYAENQYIQKDIDFNKAQNFNQKQQNDTDMLYEYESPYQTKPTLDKYDQYIDNITKSVRIKNQANDKSLFDDDEDDDLINYVNSNLRSSLISNYSTYGKVRNYNDKSLTLEKLIEQEEKKAEIPVDTDLTNESSKKVNASRIQSVLSKSSINFNFDNDDSDSDKINLSDVQFYHVNQAKNAKIFNIRNSSSLSGVSQSQTSNIGKLNKQQLMQSKSNYDENDFDDDEIALMAASRARSKMGNSLNEDLHDRSMKQNQTVKETPSKRNNSENQTRTNNEESLTRRNTENNLSRRMKEDASSRRSSEDNLQQRRDANNLTRRNNEENIQRTRDDNYTGSRRSSDDSSRRDSEENYQQRKRDDNYQGSRRSSDVSSRRDSEDNYQERRSESGSARKRNRDNSSRGLNEDNKAQQKKDENRLTKRNNEDNEERRLRNSEDDNSEEAIVRRSPRKSKTFSSTRRKRSATMFEITPVFNMSHQNESESEINPSIVDQASSKIAASSSLSNTFNSLNQRTSAKPPRRGRDTEGSEFGSDEDQEGSGVKQRYQKADDDENYYEYEYNYDREDELDRRRYLASLHDEEKYEKMQEETRCLQSLLLPFPDDLYDDVFTTGTERRNEYLAKTKLAPIISYFTKKEMNENEDENDIKRKKTK